MQLYLYYNNAFLYGFMCSGLPSLFLPFATLDESHRRRQPATDGTRATQHATQHGTRAGQEPPRQKVRATTTTRDGDKTTNARRRPFAKCKPKTLYKGVNQKRLTGAKMQLQPFLFIYLII